MKVTCLQENLAKGLGIVGRAVALRSTLPITSNVLICDRARPHQAGRDEPRHRAELLDRRPDRGGGRDHRALAAAHRLRELAAGREDRADALAALEAGEARLRAQRGDDRRHGRRRLPADPVGRRRHAGDRREDAARGDHAGRLLRRHRRLAPGAHRRRPRRRGRPADARRRGRLPARGAHAEAQEEGGRAAGSDRAVAGRCRS